MQANSEAPIHSPTVDIYELTERLRQAEARSRYLESLLENQQTVYVMRAGFDQTYTYANLAFRSAFDRPGEAMVGRNLFSTMVPEDRPAVEAAGMRALQFVGQTFPVRIRKVLPEGGIMITDWELVAVTDADGTVTEIQGMGIDVTEKEHFLTQLTDYKSRLEQILESLPNGFIALDRAGAITFANGRIAKSLGQTPAELQGQNVYELLPASRRELCRSSFEQAMATGKPIDFEAFWTEHKRWIQVSAYPTQQGLVAFWRNVTAQRLSEQRVDKQSATLRSIAWVQSHKVRASAAHIMGLVNIFNRADPTDPFNQEVLDLLAVAGRKLDEEIHEVVGKAYE